LKLLRVSHRGYRDGEIEQSFDAYSIALDLFCPLAAREHDD
jgi:hypothetical protein